MSNMIVLGGNILNSGLYEKKEAYGISNMIVVDWNDSPPFTGDRHIQCDIKDYEAIQAGIQGIGDIKCVYTSADIAVPVQIQIHESLGLLAPPMEAVINAMEKGRCTDCFRDKNLLYRQTQVYKGEEELAEVKREIPLIVKPNFSSGSRGITILESGRLRDMELVQAFRKAKEASYDGKVIIEEFVIGTEYMIEMLGDDYGNVSIFGISKKYHHRYNRTNRIAVKMHYNPHDTEDFVLDQIGEFSAECYRALGLKNSFGHLEVIYTGDRIVPIEMGARSSGYIASHCVDLINDKCFINAYSEVIRGGRTVDGAVYDRNRSSMLYYYDIKPGISRKKVKLTDYLGNEIVSVVHNRENLKANEIYKSLTADHERYGYEVLAGKRKELTIDKIIEAEDRFNQDFIGGGKNE